MQSNILDSVFHAYDIRGLVGKQLNEDFFYNLGKAYVTFLDAKNIAVGYDIRPESKVFSEAFIKGATELGCNVVKVGEIATEMIYFTVGSDESLDGGVTITASHNPAGWSGCKMVGKGVKAFSKAWGLGEVREIMQTENFRSNATVEGNVTERDIFPEYKKKVLSFLESTEVKPMSIIVDAGNGIGGKVFNYIFGDLGLKIVEMYFEPDGTFPNHVPDPLKEENVKEIKEKVISEKADLGIAIDGDADRVFFIDSTGRNPSGVFTGSIFAKYFATKESPAKIVHDPRVTWPVAKEVLRMGDIPIVCKAGHSFFKDKLKETDAVFGAELSSHFYYRDFYKADSGMVTIAIMLKLLSEGLDFSKELDYLYSIYIVSGEVNYKVNDANKVLEKVEKEFSDGKIEHIDGVSVEYSDWRFNIRKSNTEPLIRLNLEATNIDLIKEKFALIEGIINGERQNSPALVELR